mgnify:CR=1 FL=1
MSGKVYDKVKELLEEHPKLRDDDMRLIVNFWKTEFDSKQMTGEQVLRWLCCSDRFSRPTSPESITRAGRKVKEEHPDLRGSSYQRRKEKAERAREDIDIVIEQKELNF